MCCSHFVWPAFVWLPSISWAVIGTGIEKAAPNSLVLCRPQERCQTVCKVSVEWQNPNRFIVITAVVCPTSHSALSLNSSALSFGSSPILPPPLQCHPPPRSHQQCFSLLSSGASSPTSTVTTALALSLDKLPEPPSLSLAEIRQLNLAFNGLLRYNGSKCNERGNPNTMSGSDASSGVYSFAGIRLNSQFMSDMMDSQSVGDGRTEYDKPAKYF